MHAPRTRGQLAPHTGWLHDWFAHDPWIAWPVAGLAAIVLVLLLVGRLVFRVVRNMPWWAPLGLIGTAFVWWRRRRKTVDTTRTEPTQWIDLRDLSAFDGLGSHQSTEMRRNPRGNG
ncbi:hypothetical protein ABH935_005700 [Catenulispora sp. GAS73]|uniref:hypothetical protein n=1 Tax=Catenulispora sp. GAS73 TaxID=3156269 RepID=UPI0035181D07